MGDAEHADDGGDADADAECGQQRPRPPAAQPEAADPEQVPAGQPGATVRQEPVGVSPMILPSRISMRRSMARGHLVVVGDDDDGRALVVQLAE